MESTLEQRKKNMKKLLDTFMLHFRKMGNVDVENENELPNAIIPYIKYGKKIALAKSKRECDTCGSHKKLQYHHVINRNMKKKMLKREYLIERHHWKNIRILCSNCHEDVEGRKENPFVVYIKEDVIKNVLDRFSE